jgi:hypothetical protein
MSKTKILLAGVTLFVASVVLTAREPFPNPFSEAAMDRAFVPLAKQRLAERDAERTAQAAREARLAEQRAVRLAPKPCTSEECDRETARSLLRGALGMSGTQADEALDRIRALRDSMDWH